VDATLDRPVFKQIADMLRADIESGRLRPGGWLPSEAHMCEEFNAGRNSVRSALRVLTGEGLLTSQAGKGHRVRSAAARSTVKVGPGARITTRMPSEAERRRLGLAEGTPVLEVELHGDVRILPGDRYTLETVEDEDAPPDA
ncbi:MAG: transcriptional regulator, GntR family, partial [Pseudonocardiales bacterium]|nr:transcriptional regulator, GntR family [Pseudonocardiales bacterium]